MAERYLKTRFIRRLSRIMPVRPRHLLFVFSCCVTFILFSVFRTPFNTINKRVLITYRRLFQNQNNTNDAFLVDTPFCKIPNLDPYDSSIKDYVGAGKTIACDEQTSFVYQNGYYIYINKTAVRLTSPDLRIVYCRYQAIWRPKNESDHNFYEYLKPSKRFSSWIYVAEDAVRVFCYNSTDNKVYTDFFVFLQEDKTIEKECDVKFSRYKRETNISEPLNVLMVGLDSISRLNFARFMPKTRKYLLEKLGAVEMFGYNKVADNTFVNIVPLTVGKFVEELPWNESMRNVPFDRHEFIWKQFRDRGFRTLYIEDAPVISIFDFGKAGFKISPGQYCNRPFALAMEKNSFVWNKGHHCVNSRLETDIHLDYLMKFLSTFASRPYFAFSFLTRLTHYAAEETHYAEESYLKFLKELNDKRLLENTVMIFYSDHGMRFGSLREHYIGKLEERLPLMYIKLPDKFVANNYRIYDNLSKNANRLTTPFDIYETLVDVLYMKSKSRPKKKKYSRGLSLLDLVPLNRTCSEAGILPHWCTCAQHTSVPANDSVILDVASTLVGYINRQLEEHIEICDELSLNETRSIVKIVPQDKLLRFEKSKNDVINRTVSYGKRVNTYIDYQVTITTLPGRAVFEGTVRQDEHENLFNVVGDVSRINLYGNQSHCVSEHRLKKFCYCKNQQVTPTKQIV